MAITLNPYLNFRDNAREAMQFYQSVFGGELDLSTFAEFGMADDPADADLIMHSQLKIDDRTIFMGADTPKSMDYSPGGAFSVSLSGGPEDDAKLREWWGKLSESGRVDVPLEIAPWNDAFGMCTDKYGITWLVNIAAAES